MRAPVRSLTRTLLAITMALLLVAGAAQAGKPDGAGQGNGNGDSGGNGGNSGSNAGGNGNGQADDAPAHGNAGDGNANAGNGNAGTSETGAPTQDSAPPQATHGPASQTSDTSDSSSSDSSSSDATASDSASSIAAPPPSDPQTATAGPGQGASHANGNAQGNVGQGQALAGDDALQANEPPQSAADDTPAATLDLPANAAAAVDAAPRQASPLTTNPLPTPVPEVYALASGVAVLPSPAGNRLLWDSAALPAGAQVQVWRQEAGSWVPVATVVDGDSFVDSSGLAGDDYRLTWSQQPLDGRMLATISNALPLVQAPDDGWASPGRWLALLMLGSVGLVGLVRATNPRRILELRVQDTHDLLTALAGLPGIEAAQLERLVSLGLRNVGQLRRLDPDAVAFWAGVPGDVVRRWQHALELLQWPALPAGAAERLALSGHASLRAVASSAPAQLLASLRETSNVDGPGMPADEAEVAGWVAEARQAVGLVPPTVRLDEAGAAPKPTARFTWPTAATP